MMVVARLFWAFAGIIVYVYVGYPALVTLLACARPRPWKYPSVTPSVTLLIAAYNEQAVIARKLENSLALDYPRDRLQILVAADGSDDNTPEIVRGYADRGVELSYSPPRRGKMAAINRAMERARGEIVVFSDANNAYAPDALQELVAPFADQAVGAVAGAKWIMQGDGVLGESEGLYWKYESFIKEQETRLGCCTGICGEILAIRRDLFEMAPDSIILDDFYTSMRIVQQGYRVVYAPKARSYERISVSAQAEIERRAKINVGWYQAMALGRRLLPLHRPLIAWQIVSHKYLRPLLPLAMAGALATNLLAVVRPARGSEAALCHLAFPVNWFMLALQVVFYGAAWVGSHAQRSTTVGKILYVPAFLVNSNSAAIVGLHRFVTGRQTPLWRRAQRHENADGLGFGDQPGQEGAPGGG